MSEFNLNDQELNGLLKERLLSHKDDAFMDMHAEALFAGKAKVVPPPVKEKALYSKLGISAGKLSFGWIFTGLSTVAIIVTTSVFLLSNTGTGEVKKATISPVQNSSNNVTASTSPITLSQQESNNLNTKRVNIEPAVANARSITTMTSERTVEPVSTKTVTPAELNVVATIETKTATPSTPNTKLSENNPLNTKAQPVEACKKSLSSCRLWKTKDLCTSPDSLKFPYQIECNNCEYTYTCKEINSKGLKAVILRVYKKKGFNLEKGFQNIILTKPDGKRYIPFAVSVDRYMNNVGKARINFKNVVDIILLFPDAEVGDKVSIDGVADAVVE